VGTHRDRAGRATRHDRLAGAGGRPFAPPRAPREQTLEREALAQKLDGQRAALTRLIEDIGAAADATLPLEALYKHARASVDLLQAGWTEARAGIALRDKAIDALGRAKESRARVAQESERLLAAWPNALAAIGLGGRLDESPAQAEAALTVWRGVPLQKSKFEDEQHRIATMRDDISAFETQVAELVAFAAADLRERPSREALDILSGRLARRGAPTSSAKRCAKTRINAHRRAPSSHSGASARMNGAARRGPGSASTNRRPSPRFRPTKATLQPRRRTRRHRPRPRRERRRL